MIKNIIVACVILPGIIFNLGEVYAVHIKPKSWEEINRIINRSGITQTGQGVKVAIIDSGIYPYKGLKLGDRKEYIHSVLSNESKEHGTFVAGIVSKVAPEVTLLDYRVGIRTNLYNVCCAIKEAVDGNADVINMSLGWDYSTDGLSELMSVLQYAHTKGVLVIAAAGNSGGKGSCSIMYPAGFPNAVAVGASTHNTFNNSTVAGFSSKGPSYNCLPGNILLSERNTFEVKPDLVAPGDNVLSLSQSEISSHTVSYKPVSGTSAAAPFVTGAAALLKESNPELSNDELITVLCNYASPIQGLNGNPLSANVQGAGLLNIRGAVEGKTAVYPYKVIFEGSSVQSAFQKEVVIEKTITIKNKDMRSKDYLIDVGGDYKRGIFFNVPECVTVESGGEKAVLLKATINVNDYSEEFKRLGNTHPTGRCYFTCGKEKINIPFSVVVKVSGKLQNQKACKDKLSKESKWMSCYSGLNTDILKKE